MAAVVVKDLLKYRCKSLTTEDFMKESCPGLSTLLKLTGQDKIVIFTIQSVFSHCDFFTSRGTSMLVAYESCDPDIQVL